MRKIIFFTITVVLSAGFFMPALYLQPICEAVTAHAESSHEKHSEEHDSHNEHKGEHGGEEKIIKIDATSMKEFGIEVDTAGPGKLDTYITLPGEIVVNPDRLAHIVPRVSGIVRNVWKTLGDNVRKGEVMAILESAELGQAKIEYLTLKHQLELARLDLERIRFIHDNTSKMLDKLHDSPALEILQKEIKGLDMGNNRSRLISSYATSTLTRETYKREKNLYEKKISSRADFLKAKRDYKSAYAEYLAAYDEISFAIKRQLFDTKRAVSVAKSSLHAAERSLHILGLTDDDMTSLRDMKKHDIRLARVEIRAPFSGTLIEKHITLGEILKDDSKAFVIADLSTVWANLNVYQKDLPFMRKGQTVIISSGHGIDDVKGQLSWISPLVGEETRTVIGRVVLPNKNGHLLPGFFVNGKVAVGKDVTSSLVIPKSAIQTINGKATVFIKTEEGFEPRPIKTGRENETLIEILSGLNSGQQYVKAGAFTLKAQLAKGSFGDGHNH